MTIINRSSNRDDSAAAPIIKEIALYILSRQEGTPVALREIREEVFERTDMEFTPGSFSGAMRDLIEESGGRVTNVERGYYLYDSNVKRKSINAAIDQLIRNLDEIATDNILKLSNQDLDTIREIPRLQETLRRLKLDKE